MSRIETGEFPWVVAVEVEEGDELDVEAPPLDLPPQVELDELLLRRVEAEPGHHQVVLVPVPPTASAVVFSGPHVICSDRHAQYFLIVAEKLHKFFLKLYVRALDRRKLGKRDAELADRASG